MASFWSRFAKHKTFDGWIPSRFVFAVLITWAAMVSNCIQTSLNLTIVAMVNQTAMQESTKTSTECLEQESPDGLNSSVEVLLQEEVYSTEDSTTMEGGEFTWSPYVQGLVLGALFFGYIGSHALGGLLAQRFSCKRLIFLSVFVASVLSLLIPGTTRKGGAESLFCLRVLQGACMGVITPILYAMVARWSPVLERSVTVSLVYVGSVIGNSFVVVSAGYFTSSNLTDGWTHVFYFTGGFGWLFCIVWLLMVHDTPAEHPTISNKEFLYITNSLKDEGSTSDVKPSIPWNSTLSSVPMWSLLFIRCTCSWGVYLIQTAVPLYLQTVLHVSLDINGVINGVMYLTAAIFSFLTAMTADVVRKRTVLSTTAVRKIVCTTCYVGTAACIMLVTGAGCNITSAFVILVFCKIFISMCAAGDYATIVDVAPRFAGPLSGIIYSVSDTMGFFSPFVTGILTEDDVTLERWNKVFSLGGIILLLGLMQFLLFGSAEVQPWAKGKDEDEEEEESSVLLGRGSDNKHVNTDPKTRVGQDNTSYDSFSSYSVVRS